MIPFQLSVKQYREKQLQSHLADWGYMDDEDRERIERKVKRYAEKRAIWKSEKGTKGPRNFDPFTDDPGCKSCRKDFKDLIDLNKGRPCVIIGKGPSVDNWQAEGSIIPENAFTIGMNTIADHIKCDYLVCQSPTLMNPIEGTKVFFTQGPRKDFEKKGWRYFPHQDDPERKRERLKWSKQKVATTGRFYSASSTVQHAIHIAWVMGASEVFLVGIDGGAGYCSLIKDQEPDKAHKYKLMRQDTEEQLDILFHGNWKDLITPVKQKRKTKEKRR